MIDYFAIGQRIRRRRKECGFSQDQLAELAEISTTHMSHIETGNTKLSLPVLEALSSALSCSMDDIVMGPSEDRRKQSIAEIVTILESCTDREAVVLAEIVRNTRITLGKYLPSDAVSSDAVPSVPGDA